MAYLLQQSEDSLDNTETTEEEEEEEEGESEVDITTTVEDQTVPHMVDADISSSLSEPTEFVLPTTDLPSDDSSDDDALLSDSAVSN